jgi:N-acetylglucosamine-6-phosphate deacetylase
MKVIEGIRYSDNRKISIEIENGVIHAVNEISGFRDEYAGHRFIAPAFIDNQVNGYVGIEFSKPDLSVEDMIKIVRKHRENGVTTFMPTVITASFESLMRSFRNLAKTMEEPEVAYAVPGFHLEGPYISPEEGYRGAHSLKDIRKPDWDEFQKLNEAAGGKILQVTLAPEVEGAADFIRKCVDHGIVVALGHHNGTADDIRRAVDACAKTVTHLGNGMANNINRFENPLWPQLADDRLMSSCILDGFHLKPEMAKVFYRAKTAKNIILTSDMTMLAGMPSGDYVWDGKDVELTPEGVIMLKGTKYFAGASLPLRRGVENMMSFTGCSLREAVDMATVNPATLYGFKDRGELKEGMRADILIFELAEGKIGIQETFTGY